MPPRFANRGGCSRAMHYTRCYMHTWWRCKANTATAMAVCWRTFHAKAAMWGRGWWRMAMRGRTAIGGDLLRMKRSKPPPKTSTWVCLPIHRPCNHAGLENGLVLVTHLCLMPSANCRACIQWPANKHRFSAAARPGSRRLAAQEASHATCPQRPGD